MVVTFTVLTMALIVGPGCQEEVEPELIVVPSQSVLTRLTQAQYRNSVHDIFGPEITVPITLEPDSSIEGLVAVGASVTSISPRGAELYEESAQKIAAQLVESDERPESLFPCLPASGTDGDCYALIASHIGRRVWRRPLSESEVQGLEDLALDAVAALEDPDAGLHYMIVAMLQSPNFLYRWEEGEPDGDMESLRFTNYEMASRLSFFLWTSTPDLELLDAADSGLLTTDEDLSIQVERMLLDPKTGRTIRDYFGQWLYLDKLPKMSKDPNVFKHYSADLGAMAREETLGLAEHITFGPDLGLDDFFLGKTTFVNRRLAAIYDIPAAVDDGFGQVELPSDDLRRGYLGQVSFLALNAHPVSSSPTQRGVFVREHFLCDSIPPPPADLNTALPEPSKDAKTVKERLVVHMEVEACAACHGFIDPVGFGFENFDGLGMYRTHENGGLIDPSGSIDDVEYSNFTDFGRVLVETPRFSECFVRKFYSYAVGRSPESGESELLKDFTADFDRRGRRVLELMEAIAMSPGFRRLEGGQP
jgi:hypothetical protein